MIRVVEVRRGQGPLPDLKIYLRLEWEFTAGEIEGKLGQGQLSKRENLSGEVNDIIELQPFERNEDYIVLMQTQFVSQWLACTDSNWGTRYCSAIVLLSEDSNLFSCEV